MTSNWRTYAGHPVAPHVLEHYSHIRIDAKRQALDALDDVRRAESHGNGTPVNDTEIETLVEVADDLPSQFAFAGLAALR